MAFSEELIVGLGFVIEIVFHILANLPPQRNNQKVIEAKCISSVVLNRHMLLCTC